MFQTVFRRCSNNFGETHKYGNVLLFLAFQQQEYGRQFLAAINLFANDRHKQTYKNMLLLFAM